MNRILSWFPSIAPLYRRFAAASVRERVLIGISIYLFIAVLLYYFILDPALGFREEKLRAQDAASNALSWMIANQAEARRLGSNTSPIRNESKLTVISSSAELHSITIRRMQPGESRIDVELSNQEYLAVIKWLIALEIDHGIELVDIRLEKTGEGVVNGRLTLR